MNRDRGWGNAEENAEIRRNKKHLKRKMDEDGNQAFLSDCIDDEIETIQIWLE